MADVPFDMSQIKDLFKNKWMVGGVAVAVAAGGFVLYKKKAGAGSTGTGAASPDAAGATTVPYGSGFMNTSGNDYASWVGQYSGSLQNQLDAFSKQQTDFLAGLTSHEGGGTTGTVNVGPYPGTPRPTTSKAYITKSGDTWASVRAALGFSGTGTSDAAFAKWNATHSVTAGGKKSNQAASGYAKFGVGTVLAVPSSSPGLL